MKLDSLRGLRARDRFCHLRVLRYPVLNTFTIGGIAANPKSPILRVPLSDMKILAGFKSK
jgi:hypothetical protein